MSKFWHFVNYYICPLFHFYSAAGFALKVVSLKGIAEKLETNINMLVNGINSKTFSQNSPDLGAEGYRYASLMVSCLLVCVAPEPLNRWWWNVACIFYAWYGSFIFKIKKKKKFQNF